MSDIKKSCLIGDERIPQPCGWRILVQPQKPKTKSTGGIIYSSDVIEAEKSNNYLGQVIAMGPLCYTHPRFEEKPWCKVGDWISFGLFEGQRVYFRDKEKSEEVSEIDKKGKKLIKEKEKLEDELRVLDGKKRDDKKKELDACVSEAMELLERREILKSEAETMLILMNDDKVLSTVSDPSNFKIYS